MCCCLPFTQPAPEAAWQHIPALWNPYQDAALQPSSETVHPLHLHPAPTSQPQMLTVKWQCCGTSQDIALLISFVWLCPMHPAPTPLPPLEADGEVGALLTPLVWQFSPDFLGPETLHICQSCEHRAHLVPLEADGEVGARAAAELEAQLPGALHQGDLQQDVSSDGNFQGDLHIT